MIDIAKFANERGHVYEYEAAIRDHQYLSNPQTPQERSGE